LLNNLIAYWPMNEVSGNALDMHTNALHLTNIAGVGSNGGWVYPLARNYVAGMWTGRLTDDALLSAGDTDFTFATWIYLNVVASAGFLTKGTAGQREYVLEYRGASSRFQFEVYGPGGVVIAGTQAANKFGVPLATTWYLLVAWHDSVANSVSIQINNGDVDSSATTNVPNDDVALFRVGASLSYWGNGRIGPATFWKSTPGLGGVLTIEQRTALWNDGCGLQYQQFDADSRRKRYWIVPKLLITGAVGIFGKRSGPRLGGGVRIEAVNGEVKT
jgi:hypothetical protein